MNWQLPILIGQSEGPTLRERTEAISLPGTTVPESALQREVTWNVFSSKYWFPEDASAVAGDVDFLFMAIFWISLVFFVGIIGFMIWFVIKYRRRGTEIETEPSPSHNTAVEVLWSVIPSILLVWIFYEGAVGYFDMKIPTDDAEEIHVMASRYNWLFTYPDGDSSAELHLVLDRPTKLIMQSKDVLHSFYVPAFRQKMDIVPGRYTYVYIQPTRPGQYRLYCTEYCGQGHSKMKTMAEVHKTGADRKANTEWIKAEHPPWENGDRTYKIQCSGCHRINGAAATGPALNLIWGEQEKTHDGRSIIVNEQYVQDSIWYPEKDVVAGYGPVSKMNSFKGQLSEEDINDLISFFKYLKDPSLVSDEAPANESKTTDAGENSTPESGSNGKEETAASGSDSESDN